MGDPSSQEAYKKLTSPPPPPPKVKRRKKIHKANAVQEIQMEDLQTSKLEEPISI
jgi:hypothetical protein